MVAIYSCSDKYWNMLVKSFCYEAGYVLAIVNSSSKALVHREDEDRYISWDGKRKQLFVNSTLAYRDLRHYVDTLTVDRKTEIMYLASLEGYSEAVNCPKDRDSFVSDAHRAVTVSTMEDLLDAVKVYKTYYKKGVSEKDWEEVCSISSLRNIGFRRYNLGEVQRFCPDLDQSIGGVYYSPTAGILFTYTFVVYNLMPGNFIIRDEVLGLSEFERMGWR